MKHKSLSLLCWFIMACGLFPLSAQQKNLLTIPEPGEKTLVNSGWLARKANEMKTDGNTLSTAPLDKAGWMPARVPGTVLTTLLENNLYPAPEFGRTTTRSPISMRQAMISTPTGLSANLKHLPCRKDGLSG